MVQHGSPYFADVCTEIGVVRGRAVGVLIKDTLSASHGHDVDRLFADARKRQKLSGHPVVNLQNKRHKAS
jgi:hypothetical protein